MRAAKDGATKIMNAKESAPELKPVLPAYETYIRDESRLEGSAEYIAFPQSTSEAAALIAHAAARGTPLTIQGARTGICGGAAPSGGIILCTEKMTAPLGCRVNDAAMPVLRVAAGMNFADLAAFLRRGIPPQGWTTESAAAFKDSFAGKKYRFAPNPTETTASLGGAFAVNASGPNSLRYGATAAHITGLTWITPGGTVWHLERGCYIFDEHGGPLPDGTRLQVDTNIPRGAFALLHPFPGLDLIDFLAASEGLVGMASELGLALQRVPAACWAAVFFFKESAQALEFAASLLPWQKTEPGGFLASAEYYDRASLDLLAQYAERGSTLRGIPRVNPGLKGAIHLQLEGSEQDRLEAALVQLLELFTQCGGCEDDTWAGMDNAEVEKYRLLRHAVPECINTEVDKIRQTFALFHKTAADFQCTPSASEQWICRYHSGIEQAGLRGFVFGHILQGRLHANLLARSADESSRCRVLLDAWAALVLSEGGLIASENGIGKIKIPLVMRYLSAERLSQIQTILAVFDPANILGGRRFFESAGGTPRNAPTPAFANQIQTTGDTKISRKGNYNFRVHTDVW